MNTEESRAKIDVESDWKVGDGSKVKTIKQALSCRGSSAVNLIVRSGKIGFVQLAPGGIQLPS